MSTTIEKTLVGSLDLATASNVEKKKLLQRIRILEYLFLNGKTSNADICNQFGISLPTSVSLINQLIDLNIVTKKGRGASEGGRKPDLYGLAEKSFYILSIHVERYKIRLAIIDCNHNIIKEEEEGVEITSRTNIVELTYDKFEEMIGEAGIDKTKIVGLGASMPGLVSKEEGKNFTYYLTEQEPEPLKDAFQNKFKLPIVILNDSKSACLAEFRFGKAKNKQDALVITMDWGAGLGIILGGEMHNGTSGFAGEFGHIPMVDDGLLCHCGKRGCLETEASGIAMVRKAKEGIKNGETSLLSMLPEEDFEKLSPKMIIDSANKGDQFCINIIAEIGLILGKGLAILIQIFNPELIILEGEIARAKQFITTPIQQSMNTYCMMQLKEKTTVTLSNLGTHASLYGATISVLEEIFENLASKVMQEA
ncbi:MAG: sugar kinase [Cytophagaceae bacterium]|nr:sugar kinase [Cytophagaceae bacterium]|tara:strand:- start:12806 stop:14074 length:1269 start_codon:yes stop_codon:yes gene_type:complete